MKQGGYASGSTSEDPFVYRTHSFLAAAALILASTCFCVTADAATEVVFLEDAFPGYAEYGNWNESSTAGIGSVSFDATSPGFAHLDLAGPWSAPPPEYQNAEIRLDTTLAYHDFEVRLRNSNNNGWDAPGAPQNPDPTYGLGSRGWGFWDGNVVAGQEAIWFMSLSPESSPSLRGSRIVIVHHGVPIVLQDMNIDLTQWHTYRIQWRADYVGVFIDDMLTPVAEVTNPSSIPSVGLFFTIWVDDFVLTGDLSGYTLGYLDVPAIDQSIDVDYVRVYEGGTRVPALAPAGRLLLGLALASVAAHSLRARLTSRTPRAVPAARA